MGFLASHSGGQESPSEGGGAHCHFLVLLQSLRLFLFLKTLAQVNKALNPKPPKLRLEKSPAWLPPAMSLPLGAPTPALSFGVMANAARGAAERHTVRGLRVDLFET